jgi:urease accessory protein
MTERSLARLLQLSSPALPVGAFSYSAGLEWAVAAASVTDEVSAESWLRVVLEQGIARWDAPWVAALMRAWQAGTRTVIEDLNARFLASRETRELYEETVQMGRSLVSALRQSRGFPAVMIAALQDIDDRQAVSYPTVWSAAATHGQVGIEDALVGYLWAWLETSVMAALKLVPLGQFAGQRLLARLGAELHELAARAVACPLDDCCNWLPGLTLASMQHETQYTRLFRS